MISLLLLSWKKNDVNVPFKSKKHENLEKKVFYWRKVNDENSWIRTRTKMSGSATLCSGPVICLVLCGRKSGVRGDRGEGVPCTVRYQIIDILSLSD